MVRVSARVREIKEPHALGNVPASNIARQTLDYLVVTGPDNVTRPALVQAWEPSADLKTWTLRLRRDVTWRNGRKFGADDVVWNLKRVLDPKTGSSVIGLMKGYILQDSETGKDASGKPTLESRLWTANAIEKVNEFTVRLNLKAPQLAIPEHLYHYPLVILDPEEGGVFKVGMNGTGPYQLVEYEVNKRAVYRARKDAYWGGGPYLDEVQIIDLGDDPNAELGALTSRQVMAVMTPTQSQYPVLKAILGLDLPVVRTGATIHARAQPVPPFTDIRVMRALRLAVDNNKVTEVAFGELGSRAEHHHVSDIHPEYFALPPFKRDIAKAKELLAAAGYPNGIDVPVPMTVSNGWQKDTAQALVAQWAEAGIRVKLDVLPSVEWNKVWDKAPFACGDWSHRPLGVMSLALAYRSGVPWNETRFSNAEFDRLLDQAEATADVAKRKEIMKRLQTILQEDGPLVQPTFRSIYSAVDKRLKGVSAHPTQYFNCNQWWLET